MDYTDIKQFMENITKKHDEVQKERNQLNMDIEKEKQKLLNYNIHEVRDQVKQPEMVFRKN